MTELEAFEAMYGKSYLRTKKPREYAIVWEAWQEATKAEREACARVCEDTQVFDYEGDAVFGDAAADAIRMRSNS